MNAAKKAAVGKGKRQCGLSGGESFEVGLTQCKKMIFKSSLYSQEECNTYTEIDLQS